ncbi:serine hydrolase FSH [Hypoxylon sp. FL1150]|nr:serine hydrolase FSH [Hypoxylon sp. FL1150]
MRFVCLHGIGTSASILETQLSTLRYRLGAHHEYEFIEGSLAWPPARGIEEAFGKQDTCYAYFRLSATSILKAVHDLAEFLDTDGPFDGVVAFSQGGALATTLIAAEQRGLLTPPHQPLKCAILLSCSQPFDYAALHAGEIRRLTPMQAGCCIHIPTAHFWGSNDTEGSPGNHDVYLLCDEGCRAKYVHSAGHGIPSGSKMAEVETMVDAMKATLAAAL